MDQLVQQITQRTGISENQARQAVQEVANFLEQRLPEPLASQVDDALSGKGIGGMGQISGSFLDQTKQHHGDLFSGGDQP